MKIQNSKFKIQNSGIFILIFFLLFPLHSLLITVVHAEKWSGVDESVVEKFAEEHGRPSREPFINTDQGDLLLFMFLIGGIIGGFAVGYYWRTLTETGPGKSVCCNTKEKADGSV